MPGLLVAVVVLLRLVALLLVPWGLRQRSQGLPVLHSSPSQLSVPRVLLRMHQRVLLLLLPLLVALFQLSGLT
jgi:hypothetical protein